jgi:isoleucyl-tRNA synthetase
VHRGTIEHRYPFCYRCDTPLIYKAIDTWFMKIEPLKATMLKSNQNIHWVPGHLRDGRFGKWLEGARDWNISRNRYWGTPLPVWLCECGHKECVGSLEELHTLLGKADPEAGAREHADTALRVAESVRANAAEKLAAMEADPQWAEKLRECTIDRADIHRHVVDALAIACPVCGKTMKRTPEVLDCWFESGSMPYAQSHYPFENRETFESVFPADFIAEGLDQTRGWFYTLTVLGAALFGREAFKNVVVNGIILAEDGKKLSKRLRNYTPPEEVMEKLGADALRLFLINSPAVKAEDLRFSDEGVQDMARSVLLPFWNAYAFLVTYANVDGYTPSGDLPRASSNELDRWIVSLLNDTVATVNAEMEQYNLYRVVPALVDFIENLTNWYIRRSRRRFWKSENDADKGEAYDTLYYVLVEFSKVMAPFLPFLSEAIYRNLAAGEKADPKVSVHLQPYPQAREELIDRDLEAKMSLVRQAVAMGRALRSRYSIKTRQPLAEFTLVIRNEHKRALLADMEQLIAEELNVKQVVFGEREEEVVTLSAKPNYRRLGKVFGATMKEAASAIEAFGAEQIEALEQGGSVEVLGRELGPEDIEIRRAPREGVEVETVEGVTAALNTEITPELRAEGLAREFVNRVQNIRKARSFEVTDRIAIRCSCPEELRSAVESNREYVCAETLAVALRFEKKLSGKGLEDIAIEDLKARVSVTAAGADG